MSSSDLIRRTYDQAMAFYQLTPWESLADLDAFCIRLQPDEPPYALCVMGSGGMEFGLLIMAGPQALDHMTALTAGEFNDEDLQQVHMLSCGFGAFKEIREESRGLLSGAGLKPTPRQIVMDLYVKRPHCQPRLPDDQEMLIFLRLLELTCQAFTAGLLQAGHTRRGDVTVVLEPSDQPGAPPREAGYLKAGHTKIVSELPKIKMDSAALVRLPRLPQTWLVAFRTVPFQIGKSDKVVRMLLVMEASCKHILEAEPLLGEDGLENAAQKVVALMGGKGRSGVKGLPRALRLENASLHAILETPLKALGVNCTLAPSIPALDKVMNEMLKHFGVKGPALNAPRGRAPARPASPKKPTTPQSAPPLEQLKAAENSLIRRAIEQVKGVMTARPELLEVYFGKDAAALLEHGPQAALLAPYADWLWLRHRARPKDPTIAERMRREPLTEAEKIVQEARISSPVSLYKVISRPSPGEVCLEDLLRGGTVRVTDQGLFSSAKEGMAFAARVFPVQTWHFVGSLGLPFTANEADEAIDYLRGLGLETSQEGLLRSEHLFGRLAEWKVGRTPMPRLANTNGEELTWHRAEYSLASVAGVKRSLGARGDVQRDEDELYRWVGSAGPRGVVPGPITLGHLWLEGKKLVAVTNSAERFKQLNNQLKVIAGVTLLQVTVTEAAQPPVMGPQLATRPRGQKPDAGVPDARTISEVNRHLTEYYLRWLDLSLPDLGGKSPREAVKTKAGRGQVQQLIRAMADPAGPPGMPELEPPRNLMRRTLGLPEE